MIPRIHHKMAVAPYKNKTCLCVQGRCDSPLLKNRNNNLVSHFILTVRLLTFYKLSVDFQLLVNSVSVNIQQKWSNGLSN